MFTIPDWWRAAYRAVYYSMTCHQEGSVALCPLCITLWPVIWEGSVALCPLCITLWPVIWEGSVALCPFIGTHLHSILKVLCRGLCLEEGFNFSLIAEQSPGYVGADLMALVTEAALMAVNRYERCLSNLLKQSRHVRVHCIQISNYWMQLYWFNLIYGCSIHCMNCYLCILQP